MTPAQRDFSMSFIPSLLVSTSPFPVKILSMAGFETLLLPITGTETAPTQCSSSSHRALSCGLVLRSSQEQQQHPAMVYHATYRQWTVIASTPAISSRFINSAVSERVLRSLIEKAPVTLCFSQSSVDLPDLGRHRQVDVPLQRLDDIGGGLRFGQESRSHPSCSFTFTPSSHGCEDYS